MVRVQDDATPKKAKVVNVNPKQPTEIMTPKSPGPFVLTTGGYWFDGHGNSLPFSLVDEEEPARIYPWTDHLEGLYEKSCIVSKLKGFDFMLLSIEALREIDKVIEKEFVSGEEIE